MLRHGTQRLTKLQRFFSHKHLAPDTHIRSIWINTSMQTRIHSLRMPVVLSSCPGDTRHRDNECVDENSRNLDQGTGTRIRIRIRQGTGAESGLSRWMSSLATHEVKENDDDPAKDSDETNAKVLGQASKADEDNGEISEGEEGDSSYEADGSDEEQDEEQGEDYELEGQEPLDEPRKIRAGSYQDMVNRLSQVDTVLSKRTKHMIKTIVRKHVFSKEDFKLQLEEMDNFFQQLKEGGKGTAQEKQKQKGEGKKTDVGLKNPYDTMLGCLVYMISRSPNSIAAVKHVLQQIRAKDPKFKPLNVLDFGAGPALATIATQDFFEDSVKTAVLIETQPFMKEIGSTMIDSARIKTLSEVNLPKDVKQRISRELNRFNDMRAQRTRGPKHVSRIRTGLWTELRDGMAAAEVLQDNHVLRDPWVRGVPKNAFRFTDTESSMSEEGFDSEGAPLNSKGIQLFDLRSLWLTDVSNIPKDIQFDLVIANYSLGEISSVSELEQVLSNLIRHTKKYLVLIEPGHGHGFSYIRLCRDYAIKAGMNVVAPCLHNLKCPAGGTTQFCHFIQRFDMPSFQRKARPPFLSKLGYEDERLSYVVLEKVPEDMEKSDTNSMNLGSEHHDVVAGEQDDGAEQSPRPWGRLLRSPVKSRGHVVMDACTSYGTLERNVWSRSSGDRDDYRRARKLLWGDVWVKQPLLAPRVPGYIREDPKIKKRRAHEQGKANKRASKKHSHDEEQGE